MAKRLILTVPTKLTLTELDIREVSIILAALRHWQNSPRRSSDVEAIADNGGDVCRLDDGEIDALCEKINTRDIYVVTEESCG
jgi:hypothetical protein